MAQCCMRRAVSRSSQTPSIFNYQHRTFSSSSILLKEPVPSFTPTSSPELDGLLEKFRKRLFIPMSLPQKYKKIIFSPKKSAELAKTPVLVPVNPGLSEEQYQLEPLTHEDLPRRSEALEVLKRMQAPEDWRNLVPFLTGLVSSGRSPTSKHCATIVRLAGKAGMSGVVLAAAKQASRTGLLLGYPEVARELFQSFHLKAQNAEFKGEELEAAFREAQEAAFLLYDPRHAPEDPNEDPKVLPEIIGILLELSAARAIDAFGAKDKTGDVQKYASIVSANWKVGKFELPEEWWETNNRLRYFVPLWHGMKLAQQVQEVKVDSALSKELSNNMEVLGTQIEKAVQMVISEGKSENRVGVQMSKLLYKK
ncbi:hypothetical protein VTO42DRAFT_6396 [Malbranchea cinnamomea]